MLLPIFTPCANRGIQGDTMDRANNISQPWFRPRFCRRSSESRLRTRKPTAAPMIFLEPCLAFTWSLPSQQASGRCRPVITPTRGIVRWTRSTPRNVQNLHIAATMSTGIPHGHEGQPLVVNNTLYIVTPFPNNLIAYDITKPGMPQKWIFHPEPDNRAVGVACCDVVNRGASYADGKIIYNTLDDHTVAVDANTGQRVWETQVGEIKQR